jgi:hypothetical protein
MARTAVIAGTATVAVGATKSMMGGGSSKQAAAAQQAAQQDAAQDQQMAELQAQQAQLAAQQEALAQQQAAAQAAAGPAPGSLDYQANEIRKLQVMKDQGLLTDEEFAAKKAQILGI